MVTQTHIITINIITQIIIIKPNQLPTQKNYQLNIIIKKTTIIKRLKNKQNIKKILNTQTIKR